MSITKTEEEPYANSASLQDISKVVNPPAFQHGLF